MKTVKVKIAEKKIKQIKINTDFIRLDSALKLADLVQSGGHAKALIQDGEVKVNGETELQRGKKIVPGDVIEYKSNSLVIKKKEI